VRLAHPLYAEVIGARVSPLRARAVFRELTAAVEAAGSRGLDDRLRVATWQLEAGVSGSAPGQLMSAAQLALDISDFGLAERLARAAAMAGSEVEAERPALPPVGRAGPGRGRLPRAGNDPPPLG